MPTVKKFEAIRDLSGCDIFYIPAEEEGDIDNILLPWRVIYADCQRGAAVYPTRRYDRLRSG